jgi:hypothetical protein
MQIPPLDINILIIAALIAGALYGGLAGKFHLRLFILSIYVGLVLAQQLGGVVHPYLASLSSEQVNWLLLAVPILIFSFAPRGKHSRDRGSSIINLGVGLAAGALLVTSALQVLPTSQLETVTQDSFLALQLNQWHLWLLGLLPLAIVVQTFHQAPEKSHH